MSLVPLRFATGLSLALTALGVCAAETVVLAVERIALRAGLHAGEPLKIEVVTSQ